ncbi:uncharacterized protein F4812DRAFT_470097 [Daldinia caldariorum]|uniref:uncharacterized protein n=1 Tax=Daldinia caldariorum TaxID=326644 RepID=UPI0020079139|nr:uncharacterized protein F4812DRAFT_470097 [Daldinia caldariorum]KAI1470131.1 hypothetical protein F4812DRAFT_470097 [Daldinia caldariorum]
MDFHESLLDDPDLEPDEYARVFGLSADSRVHVPDLLDHFKRTSNKLLADEWVDDTSLTPLHIPRLIPQVEQLGGVSKESLEILRQAALLGREDKKSPDCPTQVNLSDLKLELPLLGSDPEYDCRELTRSMRQLRRADIDLASVPKEPLRRSNDETLDFPESSYQYLQALTKEIRDEKINIPKEALIYLSQILKDTWTKEKTEELLDNMSHRRVLRDLALTPPLSPQPQDLGYFVPDDAACQVPVSSDTDTLLGDDLTKAEADLLREDDYHMDVMSLVDLEPLTNPPSDDIRVPNMTPLKIESIKVEGPLTPLDSLPPSSDLVIDVADFAKSIDIDHVLDEKSPIALNVDNGDDLKKAFGDDVMTILGEKAKSVQRNIDQEKLQTADAIARIEIPIIDFSIPDPDWRETPLDPALQLGFIRRTCEAFNVPLWPKDSQAERTLRWSPFLSKVARVSMNEIIADDGTAEALLNCLSDLKVPTSGDYVWKQPGLAILREQDDEEEEEQDLPHISSEKETIESLVRKRRLELNNSTDSSSPVELVQAPQAIEAASHRTPLGEQSQLSHLLLGCDDPCATSTLLSNYVNFHTAKRQKNLKSSFFSTFSQKVDEIKADAVLGVSEISQPEETIVSKAEPEAKVAIPSPCPPSQSEFARMVIIKALTLERGVLSRLEKSYQNIEIIERDFDRWNSLTWNRNSVSRSPIKSPLAAEADIIVSPATGVMITTLLRAIQKPPPGQKGRSTIRERIRSVALRYERLIILVSEWNRVDETARNLTLAECAGYADFVGFTTGLDTDVLVYYVGGGDDTLVKWLVSFLVRHIPDTAAPKDILIQEETLWELFLRRAGLNAYAAQAILGQLKAPDDTPEEQTNEYGLSAFIKMAPMERVRAFRSLMGGERVLNRVNEALETQWG